MLTFDAVALESYPYFCEYQQKCVPLRISYECLGDETVADSGQILENRTLMEQFNTLLFIMALVGMIVMIALYFVDAGYGKMISSKWGPAISNKVGWLLMECPVFLVMLFFWAKSDVQMTLPYILFFLFFELHYFQRSFVFPLLMKGNSKMPLVIMAMSIVFNLINGYIQGRWLFELAPSINYYSAEWIRSWQFIAGTIIFFTGMGINLHSDHVIRNLRKPGDTNHYLPQKGMYKYVTSANYLGEIIEWAGFALLTWSFASLVFLWFTCANLVPRSNSIYHKYEKEFPDQFDRRKLKRIFPFIY